MPSCSGCPSSGAPASSRPRRRARRNPALQPCAPTLRSNPALQPHTHTAGNPVHLRLQPPIRGGCQPVTRVSHDPVCAPGELLQLVRAGLRNPVKVEVKVRLLHAGGGVGQSGDGSAAASGPRKTSATPSSLSLFYMLCEEEQRLPQLLHFLGGRLATGQKIMCYFLTCAQVDYFRSALPLLPHLKGAAMGALHGKMAPSNRLKAYEWFVAQKPPKDRGVIAASAPPLSITSASPLVAQADKKEHTEAARAGPRAASTASWPGSRATCLG